MTDADSYLTKENPSAEDWIRYNEGLFARLKGQDQDGNYGYAPFTDVDQHAAEAGVSTEDFFEQIREKVGPLGRACLTLVHSKMDDAWHIVVAPTEPEA